MKVNRTSDDIRRIAFVENLYKQLRAQTQSAIEEHDRMVNKASEYLKDGVSELECAELLVIDGVSRDVAENYVREAKIDAPYSYGEYEYSFQFEDVYGKVWSSHDISHAIYASSDEEAWEKAETKIFSDPSIEPERVVSVDRVS
jgi:hypothetical protein